MHCIYSKKPQFGTDDRIEKYILNSAGYITQTETDVTNDGKVDKVTLYTLDVHGNVLQKLDYNRSYDVQGIATDTLVQKEVYGLNSLGNTVSMTRYMGTNTTPTVIETYELNALGQSTKALIDNYGDNVIDRAEIYTLDANGYRTKMENDIGNDGSINSNTIYHRDAIGRVVESITTEGSSVSRTVYELDNYGNSLVTKTYAGSSKIPNGIYTRTYNALSQVDTLVYDRTGNGLTRDDTKYTYTYDEQGRKDVEVRYRAINDQKLRTVFYKYDDNNLVIERFEDLDGNGIIDSERDLKNYLSHDSIWFVVNREVATDGKDAPIRTTYLEHNDSGIVVRSLIDTGSKGNIDRLDFGTLGGDYTVNHQENFTQWSIDRLTRIKGLNQIVLSNTNYQTEITLDQATIGKIAPTGTVSSTASALTISGDTTDTVNLEGSGFTKLTTTYTNGTDTFDMYSTTVNNTTYTLFIDNDVNTILG